MMAAIANEECVRSKLSANLHDVGTVLSTVKLYLNMIQPAHLSDKNKITALRNCKDLIDNTVQTARDLSSSLQPTTIKHFGLTGTLQNFCNKLDHTTGIQTTVSYNDDIDRFQTEQELAAFRIVEELTDNIVKHANAKNVNYSLLRKANNKLQIFIEHDGEGLSNQEFEQKLYSMQGLGLKNIRNRLNILKGNIHFEKSDNLMNTISVQIPVTF